MTFREESSVVVDRVLLCSGCSDAPHDPGECGQAQLFTKKPCTCTYDRSQVYERAR